MNFKLKLTVFAFLFSLVAIAQDSYTLTGIVTSGTDKMPIPGVNVIIVNTTKGATTDFNGKYEIEVKSGEVLQFSYLGYTTQTVIIDSQTTLNVELIEDTSALDEVVVIGYGTRKKKHLTGAVSSVVNKNLDKIAVARVDDALVGQIAGLNEGDQVHAGEPSVRKSVLSFSNDTDTDEDDERRRWLSFSNETDSDEDDERRLLRRADNSDSDPWQDDLESRARGNDESDQRDLFDLSNITAAFDFSGIYNEYAGGGSDNDEGEDRK